MGTAINLHNIFRYLINDDKFLLTIIDTNISKLEEKKKTLKYNLMDNMVSEYVSLLPYDKQKYNLFPYNMKLLLNDKYERLGIKNTLERNMNIINISFLNSLNILLRPELKNADLDEQVKSLLLLESYISHTISRNYKIDKIKNIKRFQLINKELVKNMIDGKISHDLINNIINIFEINLVVFDLSKNETYLYWTRGTKYPYFNVFKDIYFMTYIQGNYEPIIPNIELTINDKHNVYATLLTNISEIKIGPEFKLSSFSLLYINTWLISTTSYLKIIEKFYGKNIINLKKIINEL